MTDLLVVNSKVREAVKNLDMNISGDFAQGLSNKVQILIEEAVNRTKAHNKKTVKACDL